MKHLIVKLNRTLLLFILLIALACSQSSQKSNRESVVLKNSSGNDEVDQIRKEIGTHPTDASNYEYRKYMLTSWVNTLQQQGAITADRFTRAGMNISNIMAIEEKKEREEALAKYSKMIDEGYLILDSIQNELIEDPSTGLTPLAPEPKSVTPPVKNEKSWPNYQGSLSNVGSNGNDGPVYGRIAWKFPVGLAWESRPVIVDDKVYITSPGIRNILSVVDINTGEVTNTAKQHPVGTYNSAAFTSTPVVLNDYVLLREMGSRGNSGRAKEVAYINKNTWEIEKETFVGHVDYRFGYAPVVANEKYMVYPFSYQGIELTPPKAQAFNHIICKDTKTGEQLRDVHVGQTFAEPLLDDDKVFIGTKTGYVYCFNTTEKENEAELVVFASDQEVTWKFKAGDAVNRRVAIDTKQVYFGANDGAIYSLNKETGELIWKYTTENPVPEAFRQFSTPFVSGNRVFIGSADKNLYCLDASSGELIFKHASSDWVRACPVATETNVYFASMNGNVYNIDYSGNEPKELWHKRIGNHFVYADLAMSNDKLVLNNSDLYSYCIDAKNGDVLWRHSILKSFDEEDGYRVFTDQIAGGGYYQSKAVAVDGTVFIGTPSRFVYAMDADTGEEKWKFEMGAAVSAAPVYDNGKIYAGQQGGEDDFYCIDAETGKPIWKQNVGWVWGSAAVSDGLVFIPGIDGYVVCLDANNGNMIWRFRTDKSVCSEPLVMGDYVYFGSWDSFFYKFEKRTGKLVWKYAGGGSDSGVAIGFEGKIVSPGAGMACIDAETGELLWYPKLIGDINTTPAYHDGQVFIPVKTLGGKTHETEDNKVLAFDAETGEMNWSFTGVGGYTAPVVGNNGYVYCGSHTSPYFYAINEKGNGDGTTNVLFRVRMANKIIESTPALYRGRAYILSAGGYFYAIE